MTYPQAEAYIDKKISFSYWLPWQPEFSMEFNFLNNFNRVPLKDHFCEVCLQLALKFRRFCLKKLLTSYSKKWFYSTKTLIWNSDADAIRASRIVLHILYIVKLKMVFCYDYLQFLLRQFSGGALSVSALTASLSDTLLGWFIYVYCNIEIII